MRFVSRSILFFPLSLPFSGGKLCEKFAVHLFKKKKRDCWLDRFIFVYTGCLYVEAMPVFFRHFISASVTGAYNNELLTSVNVNRFLGLSCGRLK